MSDTTSQRDNPRRMGPLYAALGVAVALSALGAGYAHNWGQTAAPPGREFTEADVAKVEQSIKTEFARRSGLNVEAVKMVRESPGRLTGTARIRTESLGMVEKACKASLSDRGLPIWKCSCSGPRPDEPHGLERKTVEKVPWPCRLCAPCIVLRITRKAEARAPLRRERTNFGTLNRGAKHERD